MTRKKWTDTEIAEIAERRLGFRELRSGQGETVRSILDGRDTLAVMATGSGKSAIYQIAALLMEGPTVVLSPLIALQRDQLESIEDQNLPDATVLNSTLTESDRREALGDLKQGRVEYIFLAPEQFGNEDVLKRVRDAKPSLFVVDEAHCICEWGHDFRPEYLRLGNVIDRLNHPTILALTATASEPVRNEIVERLGMRRANVIVQPFDRPNIELAVRHFASEPDKLKALLDAATEAEKPGIIYCATRKAAEAVADALIERGEKAVYYHAGLKKNERSDIHTEFMSDGDEAQIIVATTAFGMGIDKPNVKFVFHYDTSESLDSYYQEIGRAGRDGNPARAILFYRPEDLGIRRFFAGTGRVTREHVETVAEAIDGSGETVTFDELRETTSLSRSKPDSALQGLADAGAVNIEPGGEITPLEENVAESAAEAAAIHERRRWMDELRIESMRAYAETSRCRRHFILGYFGESTDGFCGRCDNCEAGRSSREPEVKRPFPVRTWVQHRQFGRGLVLEYSGDKVNILFETTGRKKLSANALVNSGVLKAA